jgi:hypothetical protein
MVPFLSAVLLSLVLVDVDSSRPPPPPSSSHIKEIGDAIHHSDFCFMFSSFKVIS